MSGGNPVKNSKNWFLAIITSFILVFTSILIYQILIKDMINNRFSFCNLFLLIIVSCIYFLHAFLLWLLEYHNRGGRGDKPVIPKVIALIAINKIPTITKFKADISPCIIASLFWKKIITIAITAIASPIATTKRITFFISSNILNLIHQKLLSKINLKQLWVSLTLKNKQFFSVFDTPVRDTHYLYFLKLVTSVLANYFKYLKQLGIATFGDSTFCVSRQLGFLVGGGTN